MRRNSHFLLAAVSAALAAVLLIAGGLLLWGSAYVHNTVQSQLAAQQITFPPAAAFAHPKAGTEITPNMIPWVSQYAGQQLLTGQQAEAYADHFIALHITAMARRQDLLPAVGRCRSRSRTTPRSPGWSPPCSRARRCASMLLNAYGWWKVSQITYIAALVSFGLGTVAAFVAGFAFVTGRRTKTVAEVLPNAGAESPVKVA